MPRKTLGTLVLVILASLGCSTERSAAGADDKAVVRRGTFVDDIILTGEVDAERAEAIVVPPLPEWRTTIQWIEEDGAKVAKGDRLVELDTSSFASSLEDAQRSEVENREKLLQKTEEARADIADKELDFIRKKADLDKAKLDAEIPADIVSVREYDERQLALDRARTEFDKAKTVLEATRHSNQTGIENIRLDLAESQRQVEIAQRAVETMTIYAPVGGIFVINTHPWRGKKIEVGDMAWVGFVIARIPDLDTLEIHARLADVDDRKVVQDMPVTVTMDAWPGKNMRGHVSRVSPVAEEEGGTSLRRFFQVVVSLDDEMPDGIRPGLSARVSVETARIENALIVPRAAVDFAGESAVIRLEGGEVEEASIVACNAMECAIESSVPEGTRLARGRPEVEVSGS